MDVDKTVEEVFWSKFNFLIMPLLLLFEPSTSNVLTFFGSKLFLLFRFEPDDGDVIGDPAPSHLFGDIIIEFINAALLFMDDNENG